MSVKAEDMGDWRRTHYSDEIGPALRGQTVTVFGWVSSIRRQGGISFIIIQDKNGILQLTAQEDAVPKKVTRKIEGLSAHTSIAVRGTVKPISKAPHGAEIIPREIRILGVARGSPPFHLYGRSLPSIDKRLEVRALDLRRPDAQSIFKIRHTVLQSIREFLSTRGYFEVNTPKIIATATEGGAALFPLLYYDKEAFLTQSPQLYKEELVLAFEKVYEIGPAFRAEQSRTMEHLSEFISVDVEEAYVDYEDQMNLVEEMTRHVLSDLLKRCSAEVSALGLKLKKYDHPFRRYTYSEIIDLLSGEGLKVDWGQDFTTSDLDALGRVIPAFYFIKDWPTASKPFYIKPTARDPKICESFDFMHESVEVSSGGSRVSSRRALELRLKEKGLKPKNFEYHLKVFDYGMPPHSGFGLGLERFVMALTGQSNIREVSFFPRDQFRLRP